MKKAVTLVFVFLLFLSSIGICSSAENIIVENKSSDKIYGGFGAVLNDDCCTLLNDYKKSYSYEYQKILESLFDDNSGANIDSLFVEINSDSDFKLMDISKDIKEINPDISICLVFEENPKEIISSFEESYESGTNAIIERYIDFVDYGVDVDTIFPLGNNFTNSSDSKLLKKVYDTFKEKNIKIGAFCDYSDPTLAQKILSDNMLLGVVDVFALDNVPDDTEPYKTLSEKYGKEIISIQKTKDKSPFSFACEIMNRYKSGFATSFAISPVFLCAYSETNYYPDGLITASAPYSGYFECTDLFCAVMHFTHFTEKGWQFIKSASSSDCLALKDPLDNKFSVIMINDSDSEKEYVINLSGFTFDENDLKAYATNFDDKYFESVFVSCDNNTVSVKLPANSAATLTNSGKSCYYEEYCTKDEIRLSLPYNEDFDSSEITPLYFQTVSGKFVQENGKLVQKDISGNVSSCVIFGDSTWADYTAGVNVSLADNKSDTYAGICARYVLSDESKNFFSGYSLLIYGDGKWKAMKNDYVLGYGVLSDFSYKNTYSLKIEAENMKVSAYIDNTCVFSCKADIRSGKVSLVSSSSQNIFDDVSVISSGITPYVNRIFADEINISGNFTREESTYLQYDREIIFYDTKSTPQKSELSFSYTGGGFSIIGENEEQSVVDIYLDDEIIAENKVIQKSSSRECVFYYESEDIKNHTVKIIPKSGKFVLNAIETDEISELIKENKNKSVTTANSENIESDKKVSEEDISEESSDTKITEEAVRDTQSETAVQNKKSDNIILKSFIFALIAGGAVFILSYKLK